MFVTRYIKTVVFRSTDDSDVIDDQTTNENQTTGHRDYVDMSGEPTVTSAQLSTSSPGDAYVTHSPPMSDEDAGRTYMNVQKPPEEEKTDYLNAVQVFNTDTGLRDRTYMKLDFSRPDSTSMISNFNMFYQSPRKQFFLSIT